MSDRDGCLLGAVLTLFSAIAAVGFVLAFVRWS